MILKVVTERIMDLILLSNTGIRLSRDYLQTFVEKIFDNHVNWVQLLQNDENYKKLILLPAR